MPLSEAEELELLELEEAEGGGQAPQANEPSAPDVSSGESALRGAAQGASFGFADELTGAGEALLGKATGDERSMGDIYRQSRDESRANYKAAEQSHPALYNAPKIAGGVATAVLSKAPVVGPMAGAAMGGLQGLGESEADITQGDYTGAARDTGIGATTGLVAGTAGSLLSKGGKWALKTKLPEKFANITDVSSMVRKALTGRASQVFNQAGKSAGQKMFGKFADGVAKAETKAAASSLLPDDMGSQVMGRLAIYQIPGLGKVQAASDMARGVSMGQKGLDWAIQNAPESFGKFAGTMRAAFERGGSAPAITHFILQQKNPEYQKMLKDRNSK